METLRLRAEKAEDKLSIAQTDTLLHSTLQEKARKQLDAKVVELEEVESWLDTREDELITVHDAQTKVGAELEQCRTQTASRASESVKVHSAAKDRGTPTKRANVNRDSENSLGRLQQWHILLYSHSAMSSRVSVKR